LGSLTTATGDATSLTVGYQSDYTDSITGNVNMTARWYNQTSGQFTSSDPADLSDPANANLYSYCAGNPIGCADPTGMSVTPFVEAGTTQTFNMPVSATECLAFKVAARMESSKACPSSKVTVSVSKPLQAMSDYVALTRCGKHTCPVTLYEASVS